MSKAPVKRKTTSRKRKIAILGGAGYAGSELLRLLLWHPMVEVIRVTSSQHEGQPVWRVHPILRGSTHLQFEDLSASDAAEGADLVFCALPPRSASKAIRKLDRDLRVIDLSEDFRLSEANAYRKSQGKEHPAPELLEDFVYGLPEFDRDRIVASRRVACPGAFATAALLTLLPLAREGILTGPIVLNGVTGSSELGAEARLAAHHPERDEAYRAFKMTDPPNYAEIYQQLVAHGASTPEVTFLTYLAPMVRGLFMTAYVRPLRQVSRDVARRMFEQCYAETAFIRLMDGSPDCNVVCGSNFADVSIDAQGSTLVVMAAIDNLVKGGAGQAVQVMNLMFGWDERTGLGFPGMRP